MEHQIDRSEELKHFSFCQEIIKQNISYYEEALSKHHAEAIQLHAAINSGDTELYNRLITATNMEEHAGISLRKNTAALDKPYFGRVDYRETVSGKSCCVYIGKNGIFRNLTEVLIADWRAPVSGIYYENELGPGYYGLPDESPISIDLHQKRTFHVEAGSLLGYYDSDVASNDELLVKYLARNKSVVLREIISTIQREQNAIIRETPFANIIVQGVAGSGKTTVAMHRISYLLYNYKHRFESNEYCVVGSNDLQLNYITGILPELDAPNIRHMRMDQLFIKLFNEDWNKPKRSLLKTLPRSAAPDASACIRCQMSFIQALEDYLSEKRTEYVPVRPLKDPQLGTILSPTGTARLLRENPSMSVSALLSVLDERAKSRIMFLLSGSDKDFLRKKLRQYKGYYKNRIPKTSIYDFYLDFLSGWIKSHSEISTGDACKTSALSFSQDMLDAMQLHYARLQSREYDIYDLAALALIYYRIARKASDQEFSLLFLDEAQDFGISVYYVLKTILPDAHFTIMGDVSQNINYATGLNDWEDLKHLFLTGEKDQFHLLQKSYRNTIEISQYAGRILDKASLGKYKIEPVIRHGIPVQELEFWSDMEAAEFVANLIKDLPQKTYTTAAVICMSSKEAGQARTLLETYLPLREEDSLHFSKGTYVLPVNMVKGLEFDTVILWNPSLKYNLQQPETAKLLYVAATRALHELYIVQT